MIQEAYLIIEQGYEGIQNILYLTTDPTEALNKVMEYKNEIIKAKEHKAKVLEEFGDEEDDDYYNEWDRMYLKHKTITYKEHDNANYKNIDDFCVIKWNGKEFGGCVCTELGCPPSENKVY